MSSAITLLPRICPVLAIVAVLVGAHPDRAVAAAPTRDSAVADTVRALESARARALLSADTTALSRMTADEFVEISRIAQLRTKADNIREIGTGTLKLTAVNYDSLTVQVYGDVAILRGLADNTGTFRGFPFAGKLRYTRVFVRRDGRWQAVAMQHTMLP
jgi:ketosteroid isomerase-like protein